MGRQYDDALEFLLDGVIDGCTDLTPSNELRHLWAKWGALMVEALHRWASKHADLMRVPVGYILTKEDYADYDVYQTLAGAGVGIWDGRWDEYFVNRDAIESLSKYLKQVLSKAFYAMEMAISDEAHEQCEDKRPKQKSLFS